jgi:hypothetical protein
VVQRFVSVLGAMLIAVGCASKWVHPDPDADWDTAYAECSLKAEAAGNGEALEQAAKDCLEGKGWVEDRTSKRRQPSGSRTPRPRPRRTPRPY